MEHRKRYIIAEATSGDCGLDYFKQLEDDLNRLSLQGYRVKHVFSERYLLLEWDVDLDEEQIESSRLSEVKSDRMFYDQQRELRG